MLHIHVKLLHLITFFVSTFTVFFSFAKVGRIMIGLASSQVECRHLSISFYICDTHNIVL